MFRDELFSGEGDVVIYLNSPGGDCIAASQIYTMLMDYTGNVTIKIDGIAASAASVIAMAGTSVLMAPTSLMMIHNPMTAAFGSKVEMEKAIEMLEEVKESIVNAYELRTGLSRARISHLMDSETWMNAKRAIELGFADGMLTDEKAVAEMPAFEFSDRVVEAALINKIAARALMDTPMNQGKSKEEEEPEKDRKPEQGKRQEEEPATPVELEPETKHGRSVDVLMERLNLLKN